MCFSYSRVRKVAGLTAWPLTTIPESKPKTMHHARYDRREVLRATSASLVAGPAFAGCLNMGGTDEEFVADEPDYGGWFDDVENYDGTLDRLGEEEVQVLVGTGDDGLQFDPPAILVDHLTTVIWEWTGEGGAHNVVHEPEADDEDPAFESELMSEEGATFEHTFNHEVAYRYYCAPHRDLGMKGAVTVEH